MRRPRAHDGSRPTRAPARAGKTTVVATIAVLLALFATQFGQLTHFLLVRHSVCVHGDLIHGAAPAHEDEAARLSSKSEASADARAIPGDRHTDAHEHCDAAAVRFRTPELLPFSAPPSVLTTVTDDILAPSVQRAPIGVLTLAPKSSPPRA